MGQQQAPAAVACIGKGCRFAYGSPPLRRTRLNALRRLGQGRWCADQSDSLLARLRPFGDGRQGFLDKFALHHIELVEIDAHRLHDPAVDLGAGH